MATEPLQPDETRDVSGSDGSATSVDWSEEAERFSVDRAYVVLCEHAMDRRDDGTLTVPCPLRTLVFRRGLDIADAEDILKTLLKRRWVMPSGERDEVILLKKDGVKQLAGLHDPYVPLDKYEPDARRRPNAYIPVRREFGKPKGDRNFVPVKNLPRIRAVTILPPPPPADAPIEPLPDPEPFTVDGETPVIRRVSTVPLKPEVQARVVPKFPIVQASVHEWTEENGVTWVSETGFRKRLARLLRSHIDMRRIDYFIGKHAHKIRTKRVMNRRGRVRTLYRLDDLHRALIKSVK